MARLSESQALWSQLFEYYEGKAQDAWHSGDVPFHITSNAHQAKAYARLIEAYVDDHRFAAVADGKRGARAALDPNEPLYIIELGAGHGQFALLLLAELARRFGGGDDGDADRVAPRRRQRVVYVATDLAPSNVAAWQRDPRFAAHARSGLLDFAVFDCLSGRELRLRRSGATLAPGTVRNPLVVVANYLFDSLPADAFRVARGALLEGRLTVDGGGGEQGGEKGGEQGGDGAVRGARRLRFGYEPVDAAARARYYVNNSANSAGGADAADAALDGDLDAVLNFYRHFYTPAGHGVAADPPAAAAAGDDDASRFDGSFLLPCGSIRCVARLARLLRNDDDGGGLSDDAPCPVLVLCGDKGYADPACYYGAAQPHFAFHGGGGCFSTMVNFHARASSRSGGRGSRCTRRGRATRSRCPRTRFTRAAARATSSRRARALPSARARGTRTRACAARGTTWWAAASAPRTITPSCRTRATWPPSTRPPPPRPPRPPPQKRPKTAAAAGTGTTTTTGAT